MSQARELRFAFVVEDYGSALHLFRDVLGLEVVEEYRQDGAMGAILRIPTTTLELFDVRYGDLVDEVEVGRRLGERVRIAVRVDNLEDAALAVADAGAEPMAPPVETPWGDRNRRFRAIDGMQLTLFQAP